MKTTLALIFLAACAECMTASALGTSADITVNSDNRGIVFEQYEKLTALKQKMRNAKAATECTPAELKANQNLFTEMFEVEKSIRGDEKNKALLESIYDANPEAFNHLARLYVKILPDPDTERKASEFMQAETMKASMSMSADMWGGLKEARDKSNDRMAESEKKPLIFYFSPPDLTSEQTAFLEEFNSLERKLREVYRGLPALDLEFPFIKAVGQGRSAVVADDAQKALASMASNVRKLVLGKDTAEQAVTLLGKPTSRVTQNGIEVLRYKYNLPEKPDPDEPDLLLHSAMHVREVKNVAFASAEINCDTVGKITSVSVVKTDAASGAVEEIYSAGKKP